MLHDVNSSIQTMHTVLIFLSVHSAASFFAKRVTSSEASAMPLAVAMRSFFVPPSPLLNEKINGCDGYLILLVRFSFVPPPLNTELNPNQKTTEINLTLFK